MHTNTNSIWYSENVDLSEILCPNKLEEALSTLSHKTFRKGSYIYLPKEEANKIYFIMGGQIKIGMLGDGGKEITKAILTKGEIFGELALTSQAKRKDFAYAMEDAAICLISIKKMRSLMQEHTDLQMYIMKLMGDRLLEMEERFESLVFKDSRTRIVEYVLTMAQKKGQRIGYETLIHNMLTHQEIARLTATSRQMVTTILNELKSKNIITFNRKRILIRDMQALIKEVKTTSSVA